MPASLKMAVLRAEQKADGYAFAADAAGVLRAKAGPSGAPADVEATAQGVRLARDGFALAVETTSVGRDGSPASRRVNDVRAEGQELVLDRDDDVEERFLAGPLGLEHGFALRAPPDGLGPLAIEVAFRGLSPERIGGASDRVLLRDADGLVRGGYRGLIAVDAAGRALAARMEVRGAAVALRIDDAGAAYPVHVDPILWIQQAELTASDGAAGDAFGLAVSVSGNIAVVGAAGHKVGSNTSQGAAYVFVQSGTTWTQQAELTASDGAVSDAFGVRVSVSGTTAVVGAVGYGGAQGAAYVFVQSGTTWTQQAKLTASDGAVNDQFGSSVSVSGTTAVVSAPNRQVGSNPSQGAAYVFVQSGTTWSQQAELTASDGAANDLFGNSASVSGTTVVVGAPAHQVGSSPIQGAAYVFVQSGTTWSQQAELTASDGAANDYFGVRVAVSGTTAVVAADNHGGGQGAAYVFVQSGTTWSQQAELHRERRRRGRPLRLRGVGERHDRRRRRLPTPGQLQSEPGRGVRLRAVRHDVEPAGRAHRERRRRTRRARRGGVVERHDRRRRRSRTPGRIECAPGCGVRLRALLSEHRLPGRRRLRHDLGRLRRDDHLRHLRCRRGLLGQRLRPEYHEQQLVQQLQQQLVQQLQQLQQQLVQQLQLLLERGDRRLRQRRVEQQQQRGDRGLRQRRVEQQQRGDRGLRQRRIEQQRTDRR